MNRVQVITEVLEKHRQDDMSTFDKCLCGGFDEQTNPGTYASHVAVEINIALEEQS